MAEMEDKPVIKRFVLRINSLGVIIETVDLDVKTQEEKEKILSAIFLQGLKRLGYERT